MWTLIALLALLTGFAGLISIIVPLRFIGITSRLRGLAVLGVSFVVFIVAALQAAPDKTSTDASPVTQTLATAPAPEAVPAPAKQAAPPPDPRPADQVSFIRIAEDARNSYRAADTDFKKGATRPARAKLLCQSRSNRNVSKWIGKVTELSTNSDGKGVIEIRISDHITMKTWNNLLSDISDKTLVEPGTNVFTQLGQLREGDRVIFSGRLSPSDVDCFREGSLTLPGSMTSPEFIVRFSNIEKL